MAFLQAGSVPMRAGDAADFAPRPPLFDAVMTCDFTPAETSAYYQARVPMLKRDGMQWRGACPIHHGENDNFAVDSATGRWFCHSACGRGGDILSLETELTGNDDFQAMKAEVFRIIGRADSPNRNHSSRPRIAATYDYTDEFGRLLYQAIRMDPKGFRQRRPDDRGGWVWNLTGVKRVPYRLPKLLNAETVYLPEGEKDVATLEGWGLVASCNPGGSTSSHLYAEWLDYFRDHHIVILPDNDRPGRKHAAAVAAALIGVAASVRIVELPDLPEKGDVTDWRNARGTFERFRELTDAVAPLDAATLSALCAQWRLADKEPNHQVAPAETVNDWPKPEPLHSELPPVEAFPRTFYRIRSGLSCVM
jgi:hypothetical protein